MSGAGAGLRSARVRIVVGLVVAVLIATAVVVVVVVNHDGSAERADSSPDHRSCSVSATLVPSCGVWWGVAPLARTTVPLRRALPQEEKVAGRTLDIVHTYHTDADLFPTRQERTFALQPGRNRMLLINWKPSTSLSWRQVADGAANDRIDRLARYIATTFRHRFFLSIWHEPENDVDTNPSHGMTADDFRRMYQHVISRLRHDGVTWAVTVMDYIGFDAWAQKPWFSALWPGREYVDWLAIDPYGSGATSGYAATDFATLVDRPEGSFPGYYSWARSEHPLMPIMLAEWGVAAVPSIPDGQARFFDSVAEQLPDYPMIKALVYFDMPTPPAGQPRTYLRATPQTSTAYRRLVTDPALHGPPVPH